MGKLDLSLNLKLADFNLKIGDIRLGQIPSWDLPALKLKLEGFGLDLTGVDLPNMTLGELNLKLMQLGFGLPDVNITIGSIKLDSFNIFGDFKLADLNLTLPDLGLTMPTIPDLSVDFPSFDTDLALPDFKLPDIPAVDLTTLLPKIFLRGAYIDIPDFKIGGFHIGLFKATLIEKTKDKRDYVLDGTVKLNFSDIPGANDYQLDAAIRMSVDPKFGRQVIEITPLDNTPLNLVVTPTNSTQAYTLPIPWWTAPALSKFTCGLNGRRR